MKDHARAILYLRVSTDDQVVNGASLAAQENALRAVAAAREWKIFDVLRDEGASGKSLHRASLTTALDHLAHNRADILAATALDRLSRSVRDVHDLADRSKREGWAMVTLSGEVDTTTAMGEAFTTIAATFAQLERRLIGDRTRAGMAQRKRENPRAHMGRHTALPPDVIARIRTERARGTPYARIADALTHDGIPTALGRARWSVSSVQSALTVNADPPPKKTKGTA